MKFRRITKRSQITVPCLMARQIDGPIKWDLLLCEDAREVPFWRDKYSHWFSFQWPEVQR